MNQGLPKTGLWFCWEVGFEARFGIQSRHGLDGQLGGLRGARFSQEFMCSVVNRVWARITPCLLTLVPAKSLFLVGSLLPGCGEAMLL